MTSSMDTVCGFGCGRGCSAAGVGLGRGWAGERRPADVLGCARAAGACSVERGVRRHRVRRSVTSLSGQPTEAATRLTSSMETVSIPPTERTPRSDGGRRAEAPPALPLRMSCEHTAGRVGVRAGVTVEKWQMHRGCWGVAVGAAAVGMWLFGPRLRAAARTSYARTTSANRSASVLRWRGDGPGLSEGMIAGGVCDGVPAGVGAPSASAPAPRNVGMQRQRQPAKRSLAQLDALAAPDAQHRPRALRPPRAR